MLTVTKVSIPTNELEWLKRDECYRQNYKNTFCCCIIRFVSFVFTLQKELDVLLWSTVMFSKFALRLAFIDSHRFILQNFDSKALSLHVSASFRVTRTFPERLALGGANTFTFLFHPAPFNPVHPIQASLYREYSPPTRSSVWNYTFLLFFAFIEIYPLPLSVSSTLPIYILPLPPSLSLFLSFSIIPMHRHVRCSPFNQRFDRSLSVVRCHWKPCNTLCLNAGE